MNICIINPHEYKAEVNKFFNAEFIDLPTDPMTWCNINSIHRGVDIYGAHISDKLVALSAINKRNNYLELLSVDPDERREGYGSQMLEFYIASNDSDKHVYCHKDNPAMTLYRRYNFKKIGRNNDHILLELK